MPTIGPAATTAGLVRAVHWDAAPGGSLTLRKHETKLRGGTAPSVP